VEKERTLTTEAERRSRDLQNKLETIAKVISYSLPCKVSSLQPPP